jgi:ABC-type multidrug transport system ATPase subunit
MLSNSNPNYLSDSKILNSLIFDSIYFSYRNNQVLNGIYLAVPKGQVTGIFGTNGCGKSTLLKIGSGFLKQDEGLLIIDNNRFIKKNKYEKSKMIGYLCQESFLPKDIKISDLIKWINKDYIRNAIEEDELLKPVISNKIGTISGGEDRYLEILLVLLSDKKYLFLDEPFTGLAPKIIEQVLYWLKKTSDSGKGIILCDHYMHYSVPACDVKYIMKDGQCKKQ